MLLMFRKLKERNLLIRYHQSEGVHIVSWYSNVIIIYCFLSHSSITLSIKGILPDRNLSYSLESSSNSP